MRVSIVIPVFNKGAYVEACIASVLGQSYQNIEVIAIDDGSTDDSLKILRHLEARTPRLSVHSQPNQGPSGARNAGLDRASGDYVMFHDADDHLNPEGISKLMSLVKAYSPDIAGGITRYHLEGGYVQAVEHFSREDYAFDIHQTPQKFDDYSDNFSLGNKLFRRNFLIESELSFTPFLYMQDIEFWLKALVLSKNTCQTAAVISDYQFVPGSTSKTRTDARFASLFRLFDNLEVFYAQRGLGAFTRSRNHALMRGALMFFADWKLKEWNAHSDSADLDRLRALAVKIPELDFVTFHCKKHRGITAPILLAIRSGHYADALRYYEPEIARIVSCHLLHSQLHSSAQLLRLPVTFGTSPVRDTVFSLASRVEWVAKNPKAALTLIKSQLVKS